MHLNPLGVSRYFGIVYGIWHKDEVSAQYGPALFKTIPAVAKSSVFKALIPVMRMSSKSKLLRDLNGQVSLVFHPIAALVCIQIHTSIY